MILFFTFIDYTTAYWI